MLERLKAEPQGIKLSVEEQGYEWAKGYFKESQTNLDKLVLVVPKDKAEIMALPALLGENMALRINELGDVFHYQWSSRPPEFIQAKAEKYQLLYPRSDRVEPDYLQKIPKHKEVVVVWTPARFDTIELAIRAQQHILDNVTGEENSDLTQTYGVINQINEFSGIILSGEVDEKTLELLGQKTEEMLGEFGLARPQAVAKVKMKNQLTDAFTKDSLARVNPLVTRVRLRSAYLQAAQQLIKVSRVAEKYTLNRAQLTWVRELDRWALETAAEMMGKKLLGHVGFRTYGWESNLQKEALEKIVVEIAHKVLTIPRVKPYLATARLAALALVGCKPGKLALNQQIIGNPNQIKWLESDLSVAQLINMNDFKAAGLKIEAIRGYLSDILR